MYIFQAPQKPDITIFCTGLFPLCRNETAQKPIKYLIFTLNKYLRNHSNDSGLDYIQPRRRNIKHDELKFHLR